MNLKEKYITTEKRAGRKTEKEVKSKSSYTILNSCDTCTLAVYIDLICNDNLSALIVEGNPPIEELRATKTLLITEFSEFTGNSHVKSITILLKNIYTHKAQLSGLSVCLQLIEWEYYDKALEYLKSNGMRFSAPTNEQDKAKLTKAVQNRIKSKSIHLKEELTRYGKLSENKDTDKPTKGVFMNQIALIEKHMGFRIDENEITLSKYASYINNFSEHGKLNSIKQ